jgi:hypothetical protein
MVKKWIHEKVDVMGFFTHFKGRFKGKYYDSDSPPGKIFSNVPNCEPFGNDIARHLEEGLRNGSLELVGRVGEVVPPLLVMPLLMVEGTRKNRLCHDERFLNLWMRHVPFSLEGLSLLPSLLEAGDFISSSDEKSAYLGVLLAPSSRKYFGVQFAGWYMQYTCLPFGWSESPFIYQTIGMQVTSFLRSKGMVTLQYIDDRFLGPTRGIEGTNLAKTGWSIFFNAAVLHLLGYTIEMSKSLWYPRLTMLHLGLIVDSELRQFCIPLGKRDSFRVLRTSILDSDTIYVKTLEKLMGKCMSFKLCVPIARLYIRVMARRIAEALRSGDLIKVEGDLKEEIQFWNFIDDYGEGAQWLTERHSDLSFATDSSGFAWGAHLGDSKVMYDFWSENDRRPIHIKETEALLKTLQSIMDMIRDRRVDVRVDNQSLISVWQNHKSKDLVMVKLVKSIVQLLSRVNCDMRLIYTPSVMNPSRRRTVPHLVAVRF